MTTYSIIAILLLLHSHDKLFTDFALHTNIVNDLAFAVSQCSYKELIPESSTIYSVVQQAHTSVTPILNCLPAVFPASSEMSM